MTTNLFLNRTRWLSSALCTLILLFSLSVGNAWGAADYIIPKLYLSSRNTVSGGTGWTFTSATCNNAATDYWKMVSSSSVVTSATFDISGYTNVTVSIKWGSFGSFNATKCNATVKISTAAGTWTTLGTTDLTGANTSGKVCTFENVEESSSYSSAQIQISTPSADGSVGGRLFYVEIKGEAAGSCDASPTVGNAAYNGALVYSTTPMTVPITCPSIGAGSSCEIKDYGFVWKAGGNPTISNNKTQIGTDNHSTAFNGNISGTFAAGTTYYVKAYAINNGDNTTLSSSAYSFTPRSITFNSNGGSSVSTILVISGKAASQPADPTKDGYIFGGWYTDSGLGTAVNWSSTITSNKTYYAKWIAEPTITVSETSRAFGDRKVNGGPYTMTFNVSGANLTNNISLSISGTNAGMFSVTPSSLTQSAGSVASTEITVSYSPTSAGSHSATINITSTGATSKTVALSGTGKWEVTWSNNGATSTTLVENSTKPTFPSTPSSCDATSTTFIGWATADWDGKLASLAGKTVHTSNSTMSNITANGTTFYAVFAKQSGSGAPTWVQTTSVAVDDVVVIAEIDHVADGKTGKELAGWGGSTYGTGADYTTTPAGTITWTVVTGYNSTGVAFKNSSNKYLYWSSGNSLDVNSTLSANSSWSVSTESSRAKIQNNSTTTRVICWNQGSPRFAAYDNKSHGQEISNGSGTYYYYPVFYKQTPGYTYSDYLTTCCTALGSINGSISLTQGGNSVTISGWSDVANVGTYTVRMYKKNGASWDLVSGSTSGGSAGTQGTRTGITSGSKSVTYTGLVVESEYKFTVQAIAGSASYCDGDETAVTTINSTSVSSTPFKFRYAIYIDDGTNDNYEYHYITPTGNTDEGSVDIDLTAHITSYQFKIAGGFSGWWGQTGTSNIPASTKWTLNGSNNVKLNTGAGGTYTFTVDYSGTTNPGVTVTFPSANQASGYKIYFDKSIIDGWGNTLKYRIGNNTDNQNQNFTLVTGTDNFYVTTTPSYNSMDAWQIANNTAWTPGDHDAAHGIYNYHHGDDYDITKATVYFDYVVDGDITMVPSSKKNTENGCDFWYTNKTDGMLTHTATITAPSNGTINLAYTNTSGTSCPTNTSTVSSLAHRTILTATATPATGYQLSTFTVTPSGESAQNLSSGDNHILAKDATFAATFAAKTYAISLDRNGGTTGATGVTMTYNSSSFTGWSAPTRTGYTFDGYYTTETDDNGSGTLVINSSGVLQANVDGYTGANGIWTKDATCTLYAKWTANTTTVTLTAGTGTNGSASINYDATSYTSFSAAVRVGYTCTGYWTNTGGTGTKILNGDGSFANSAISGYVTSGKWSYTTASTLTLYAGWTNTYAGYVFDLLEDVRDISAGSKIIVIGTDAGGSSFYALKTTQQTDYRDRIAAGAGEFVMSNSNKTATLGASTSVQVITLEDLATPADNTYQFNVENGYLYAASSSSNYLRTQSPNTSNGNWLIALDASTKKATVTAKGDKTHNILSHNNTYTRFSAYTAEQQPTYIYYNETRTKYTITWNKNGHGTAPTYPTNAARVTMPDISVTGYTNAGWIADKAVTNVSSGATINAGTLIPKDTRVQLSANTTFTAQWSTDVYTISATLTNISVNSAFPSSFTYTGATTTDLDRTLSVTSAYALPTNLTVTMGGNPCTNGTEYTYDSGTGAFTFNVVITGNIVITGTALNIYTITLNPGNGSLTAGGGWSADGDNLVQVVVEGNNVTLPTPTPSCAGWVFKGWKLGSAANNQSSFTPDKADGATFAPNATSTYYAVYRASTPTGTTYTKITDEAELTTGDYLIVGYPGSSYYYAMGNSITSGHMTETSSTNATSWSSPSAGYVWTIIKAGDKVGFYNANASKYLTIVDDAWVLNSTDGQKFSYSFNSTTKAWTFTSPSGKQMIYNSYFYTGDAQSSAIYLYKRGNTESGNYYTSPDCSSLTVTGVSDPVGAATVHLSSTTAKNGDVIWVTYTLNRGYTFDSWSKSGTGASLSSTSAEFTKLTVGSTAPTVTANCDALTSYTLNYHDGDGSHTMTVYEGENILSILPEPSESCDDDSPDFVGWSTSEIRVKTNTKPTYVSSSAVINSTTAASTYYAVYADAGASGDYTSTFDFQVSSGPGSPWSDASHGGASWAYSGVKFATTASCGMPNSSTLSVTLPTGSIAKSFTINGTSNSWSTSNISIAVTGEGIDGNITTFNDKGYSYNFTASNNDALEYTFTATNTSSKVAYIANIAFSYTIDAYSGFITTCCENPELAFDGEYNYQTLVRQDIHGAHGGNGSATVEQGKATLVLDYATESDGTCTVEVKKLTGGDNRSTAAAGSDCSNHTGIAINESTKKVTFDVWTYAGSYPTANGQGTYRIKITQDATSTYCAAETYYFVDVTLRDKFVDAVNGNATINVDGQSKTTSDYSKTPTEASLDGDKNDDCHSTTRRFLGWVREDNMDTWYGSSSDRTRDLDDKKDDAALVAPNADIITSGSTWYAIWGIEE